MIPAYSVDDLLRMRQNLLPRGMAWPRDVDALITHALRVLCPISQRFNDRAANLVVDAFPGTSTELLPEWEASVGLPDPCAGIAPTVAQRRAQVVARLVAQGGQSVAYFISVAAALGFPITITQFAPFRAGISRAGDPCCDEGWAYVWQVNAPTITVKYFSAGKSSAGEPLATWGNTVLQCELERLSPAHTTLMFSYS